MTRNLSDGLKHPSVEACQSAVSADSANSLREPLIPHLGRNVSTREALRLVVDERRLGECEQVAREESVA